MSNKTRLQTNNNNLDICIAKANSLPNASGQDMLQARVDATNSCRYLFYLYDGDNVDYIANLNTSNVTNMNNMFLNCNYITAIPKLDTSNVTHMGSMFYSCKKLITIPELNTSNVTRMDGMFNNCYDLVSVPKLDTSNVTDMSGMFRLCSSLKSILMTGMKVAFDISASTQFDRTDLVTILNNLATVTSSTTLTMGSTNLAKLTATDKAIATNKGWTLA